MSATIAPAAAIVPIMPSLLPECSPTSAVTWSGRITGRTVSHCPNIANHKNERRSCSGTPQ